MRPDDTPESRWTDPIVAEVRSARARLLADAGGDLDALFADLTASEARREGELVLPPNKTNVNDADAA